MPLSLLQVANNLFQTCYNKLRRKQCECNLLTTCEQTCFTTCLQTCNNLCVFTRVLKFDSYTNVEVIINETGFFASVLKRCIDSLNVYDMIQ